MKYLKMLGLAAVAAAALMAFLGAGTASATVLCKETPTAPISTAKCDNAYSAGQKYKFKATDPVLTSSIAPVTCASSETTIEQTNTGSATETVRGDVTELKFNTCKETIFNTSCAVNSVGTPFSGEIHWISGTHDGTVTIFNGKASVSCPFVGLNCVFGAASLDMKLDSGNPAKVTTEEAEMEIFEESGFSECPSTAVWDATYVATSPTAIYVGQEE